MSALITCHANADADSLSAMLAARRFYDSPTLLFPGTQEANIARVYEKLDKKLYNFADPQNIDWNAYDTLVIVDTRQKGRLKHVRPLLEKEGVRTEIWDHHPPAPDDIPASMLFDFRTGAVTSALCLALKEKKAKLTPEEAALLGLGIYGDTGSFTYSSTSVDDYLAAAWLLEQGMDVNAINEMASRELDSAQIHALNSLLESAQTYTFNNIKVVIAEAAIDHYLGDFAYLAHKLMEMEKFPVLFALGLMGDRIQIVARSRVDAINVGEICKELGGGGHAYAASAAPRSMMAAEARDLILRRLAEQQKPEETARDYMSSPAIGVETDATMREADEIMLHFGLKAAPVFKKGTRECAGLLDAQTAARAVAHGLSEEKVDEY
ncbi:MAG: DHH family phosphoesterase, partial [Desulfovibrio sp.]|nr:DHH family phosphoesterase [Desulfovibrio sp.]